jgi:membrane protease YdiL (CAAX protease family)
MLRQPRFATIYLNAGRWHNADVPVASAETKPQGQTLRELAVYFSLAYGISLVLWLPFLLEKNPPPAFLWLGTFGPTFAALVTHRVFEHNWRAVRLWSGLANLAIGIVVGSITVLIAAFTAAFFMTESGLNRWQWSSLLQIPALFIPNLLGGPLGEEAGWRGFALTRLQQLLSPVSSALVLGFLWANWHLPLILGHIYNVSWWQFTMLTIAASVFLSLTFNRSGNSVLSAIFVHGIYNVGTGVILNDLIGKATLYSNTIQHNVLWLAYGGVAVLLCVVTKGRLGRGMRLSNSPKVARGAQ